MLNKGTQVLRVGIRAADSQLYAAVNRIQR